MLYDFRVFNLFLTPDKDELDAFVKHFCLSQEKIPRKFREIHLETLLLSRQFQLRWRVEILIMLYYYSSKVFDVMTEHRILPNDYHQEYIQDYITYFFNYRGMSAAQRDLFFSRVREVPYYRLHCAVHFRTIFPQMALAAVGVNDEKISKTGQIDRLIRQTAVRLEEALLENDNKRISTLSQSLSSLSKSFLKLGGETEQSEKQVEIQYICYSKFEPELTVEQIREHNARIRAEREKQGNSDNPNEPAKPDGSVNPAKPGEPDNSTY